MQNSYCTLANSSCTLCVEIEKHTILGPDETDLQSAHEVCRYRGPCLAALT